MKTAKSKDGTPIAFDQSGAGEPLILVDGALCYRLFGPMPKMASLLSVDFTVIMYDRRGRGESGDSKDYSVERELEDLEALILASGGKANVFGISSGAGLAVLAAAKGLPINKLALYEPPYLAANDEPKHENHEANLKQLIEHDRRGDAVKYFMSDMVNVPAPIVLMMRLMPVWKKLKAVAHTLPYDAAIMGDFTLPESIIASFSIPTLILTGGKSPARLQQAAKGVADHLVNGTYMVLEKQTHNVKAEIVVPILKEFFK